MCVCLELGNTEAGAVMSLSVAQQEDGKEYVGVLLSKSTTHVPLAVCFLLGPALPMCARAIGVPALSFGFCSACCACADLGCPGMSSKQKYW